MSDLEMSAGGAHEIHQDGWTETLAGLVFLISRLEEAERKRNTFHIAILLRQTFVCSDYLVEQIFDSTTRKYIKEEKRNFGNSKKQRRKKREFEGLTSQMSLKRVGLSRAMRKWPKLLTGDKLPLESGELRSLRRVACRRNSTSSVARDLALSSRPSFLAKQAVNTAVDACKTIEKHFFPDEEFTYSGWLKRFPIEKAGYF